MKKRTKDLLIIIPAYNEEACIGEMLGQLETGEIADIADIMVINDGSVDNTGRIVREHGHGLITHIYHMGYGAALLSGYKYAVRRQYKYVIQIDADGQHDVCNIFTIYARLQETDGTGNGPDIVLGSRFLEGSKTFRVSNLKKMTIGAFRGLIYLTTGQKITDPTSGLQGLNLRTLRYYSEYSHFDDKYPDTNMVIQMLLLGYQIEEVPAVMHERATGASMHDGLINDAIYIAHMFFSICAILLRILVLKAEVRSSQGKRMGKV